MIPQGQLGIATILYDPDCDCGFERGARIQGLAASLKLGTMTPGTVLIYDSRCWRVHGAVGKQQVLVYAQRNSVIKSADQRLVLQNKRTNTKAHTLGQT